jgi:hypothetical protein
MPGADMPCGGLPPYRHLRAAVCKLKLYPDDPPQPTFAHQRVHGESLSESVIKIFLMKDNYLKGLFTKMNLTIISRNQHTKNNYNWEKKELSYSGLERGNSKLTISNIEKFAETANSAEEANQFIKANWPNTYDFNQLLRRNLIDRRVDEYMVIPVEIEFIRDVIVNTTSRHSALQHFEGVELNTWRRKVNQNQDNKKLRIDYILKNITGEQMKTRLLKEERQRKKARAIYDIYEVYARVCSDSFRKICSDDVDMNVRMLCEEWDKQEKIRIYCNRELEKFQTSFNLKVPYIMKNGRTNTCKIQTAVMDPYPISMHSEIYNDIKLHPVNVEPDKLKAIQLWYKIVVVQLKNMHINRRQNYGF